MGKAEREYLEQLEAERRALGLPSPTKPTDDAKPKGRRRKTRKRKPKP